jgi:membrane protein DedA with SNARE-associated domain
MDWVVYWVKHYGAFGVFSSLMLGMFGLPVPDETVLTLVGFLISKDYLPLAPSIIAAFLGTSCGITLNYLVGRTAGVHLLKKYGYLASISEARMERVHRWFTRYGKWTLFFGYFIPGLRHAVPLVAGTSQLEFASFARFTYSGGLLWLTTFILIGYFVGEQGHQFSEMFLRYSLIVAGAVVLLVAFGLIVWKGNQKGDS